MAGATGMAAANADGHGRASAPATLQRGDDSAELFGLRPSSSGLRARHSEGASAPRGEDGVAPPPPRLSMQPGSMRSGISSVLLVSTAEVARQLASTHAEAPLLADLSERGQEVVLEVCSSRVQPWPSTSALIVAEVVGAGVLALGGQMATVGLPFGLCVLVLCYPLNLFTALLLGAVHRALPGIVTFGDALGRLLGRRAAVYGYAVLYVYLFLTMANYMIVLSDSVQAVLYSHRLCRPASSLLGALVLLPANQLRSLSGLSLLSALSFATVLATLAICLWVLLTGQAGCTGSRSEPGFFQYSSSVSGFVFAFAGQHIMLEMQAEIRVPAHFPRAVYLAFSVLFAVYLAVAVLAYSACGDATPGELMLVLPYDGRKSLAGALMVVHIAVTYTIAQQVFNRALCVYFVPMALGSGTGARATWFCVTTASMALCYTIANSIPLFQDVVNITGAMLSTQCAFIIPGLLFLALHRKGGGVDGEQEDGRPRRPCQAEGAMLAGSWLTVMIGVCLAATGTVSSLAVVSSKLSAGGNEPFSCHALDPPP